MGRIQSNIGLITGIPIGDLVSQLMELSAKPRDNLIAQTAGLKSERVALTTLTASLVSVQYVVKNLGKDGVFDSLKATSSNASGIDLESSRRSAALAAAPVGLLGETTATACVRGPAAARTARSGYGPSFTHFGGGDYLA